MGRLKRPRTIVIGELNVDIVATGVNSIPEMGAEILAKDCVLTLGSASAIFAVGLSKLGHQVTFVSQVGNDSFGDFCVDVLQRAGVSTGNIARTNRTKTGVTIALSNTRDRALITYLGAIESFNARQIDMSFIEGHQHLHLTSYFLQRGMSGAFPKLLQRAKRENLVTSFDPNSDPADAWPDSIKDVLQFTDVLFLNEREALKFTRVKKVEQALEKLSELVPCAVIKLGSQGAIASRDNQIFRAAGFKVTAVDTTGAGDSFDAGFMSAYLGGKSISQCLETGNACGALSTLQPGGTAGQPDQKRLAQFLRHKSLRTKS
jgi:sugar/nucleoside kinase (ribokinase family)